MLKLNHHFLKNNIRNLFKEYKSAFTLSFIIGVFIATIPYLFEYIENLNNQKFIKEQRKIEVEKKEKICKDNNSDYIKFLNLGFPDTATKKFNTCMKEK